jgi:hypothetical protein
MEVTNMKITINKIMILAVFLAFTASFCAQSAGNINRVQHNVINKDDILWDGDMPAEWYFRQTVVEAPYASLLHARLMGGSYSPDLYTFVGDQGKMERGVFEIQEKTLFFYRTYSFVEGDEVEPRPDVDTPLVDRNDCYVYEGDKTGEKDNKGCPKYSGTKLRYVYRSIPLLAFPIEKHFDIIWDYNANTGEKTNVLVENDTDRLWWEREYMRVSWGTQQVINLNFTLQSSAGVTGKYNDMFLSVFEGESSCPEDEWILSDNYIDFVNNYILGVPNIYYEGFGDVPLCWFYPWYAGSVYECVSNKVKVRSAFLKVSNDVQKGYVARDYNDYEMNRFGYFRTERSRWIPLYNEVYSAAMRLINRFNIWDNPKVGNGTINYKESTPNPIVYYMNEDYPRDLVEEGQTLQKAWTKGFDDTVTFLKGSAHSTPMFVVCENNLTAYCNALAAGTATARIEPPCDYSQYKDADFASCVNSGKSLCECVKQTIDKPKRNGDLRYSFLYAVVPPTAVGLYGYGPPSMDPLTGQIITASAYNYVAQMKKGANKAVTMIEFLSGVRSFRDIVDATFIGMKGKYDRLKEIGQKVGYSDEDAKFLAENLGSEKVKGSLLSNGIPKTDLNVAQARLNLLKNNPDIESMLIGDDVKLLFMDPRLSDKYSELFPDQQEKYAPRNWMHHGRLRAKMEYYRKMAMKNLTLEEFVDNAIIGLAKEYKARYDAEICTAFKDLPAEEKANYIFNVESTEGCTVAGLMEEMRQYLTKINQTNPYSYNYYTLDTLYTSSQDPVFNATQNKMLELVNSHRDQYVEEIYKKIFLGTAIHEVGHTLGLRHNFESSTDSLNFFDSYWWLKMYLDKNDNKFKPANQWSLETDSQANNSMRMYQYSSVMDYDAKFNMPWKGLGLYDLAAIKYGYGNIVEIFNSRPDLSSVKKYLDADPSKENPNIYPDIKERGENIGRLLNKIHYTNFPNLWGDIPKMYDRKNVLFSDVIGEKCDFAGQTCSGNRICKDFYEGLRCSSDVDIVPYRFGGDELAGYMPTVDVWDEGVDQFEIVLNAADNYKNYWPFWGYWYQSAVYWPDVYYDRVTMAFWQMARQYQYWVLNYVRYNSSNYWKNKFGIPWEQDINGGLSGALASKIGFETMAGTFGRPSVTYYGYNKENGKYEPVDDMNEQNFSRRFYMREEDGARPMYPYWSYEGLLPTVVSGGAIYDRLAAMQILADPVTDFMGVDMNISSEKYLINYQTFFKDEIDRLFGGLIDNKTDEYGWCVLLDQNDKPYGFRVREFLGPDKGCHEKEMPIEPEEKYIFPTTRFRIPIQTAYIGLSLLISDYDRSFVENTRVWLKGNKTEISVCPSGVTSQECAKFVDVIEFAEPLSGKTYVAYKMKGDDFSAAYYLLNECQSYLDKFASIEELQQKYIFSDYQFCVDKVELLKNMNMIYDSGQSYEVIATE